VQGWSSSDLPCTAQVSTASTKGLFGVVYLLISTRQNDHLMTVTVKQCFLDPATFS